MLNYVDTDARCDGDGGGGDGHRLSEEGRRCDAQQSAFAHAVADVGSGDLRQRFRQEQGK